MELDEINDLDRAATWLSEAIGSDVQRNDLLSWSGRGKLKICAAIPGERARLPAAIRAHIERHAAALRQTNPAVGPAEAIDQAISRLSIEQRTELSIARLSAMQGLYPLHRFQVDAVRVHGHVMVTKARPLDGGDYVDFVEPARVTVEMLRITSDELQALRMSRSQPLGDSSRNPVPVKSLNRAQSRLVEIVEALEQYAETSNQDFDRWSMPGPLGGDCEERGSFHWFCAQLDPIFKRKRWTFKKHRMDVCAIRHYAKKSDFYRRALPHIVPKIGVSSGAKKGPQGRK